MRVGPAGGQRASGPDRLDLDVTGADRAALAREAATRTTELVHEQGEPLEQRPVLVDPLGDEPDHDHRDEQRPRHGEEAQGDAEAALDEHHGDHDDQPDAVAGVAGPPGERRPGRAEPDGVDPVHVVVGADLHRVTP